MWSLTIDFKYFLCEKRKEIVYYGLRNVVFEKYYDGFICFNF